MRATASNYYEKLTGLAAGSRLSISGLCRLAGVAPATANRWKSGTAAPSMRIWEKLESAAAAAGKKLVCPNCGSNDTEHVKVDDNRKELRACCVCYSCYHAGDAE
jgi:hypothetical protein